jgi:hypothetical protein
MREVGTSGQITPTSEPEPGLVGMHRRGHRSLEAECGKRLPAEICLKSTTALICQHTLLDLNEYDN